MAGGMRFAAYGVGRGMFDVATQGKKSLEMMRTASLGLIAAFGLAAFAAARFEKAMSEVRAVTGGNAREMTKLKQAALEAGQSTIYSATQAAKAEAELARAGIATADIIGGALKGTLALAASGQLELGESAIISAQAMNAFKLEGKDVGHIADVIAAGAGKSATNVHDMGMAFRQAALLSSQTGLSFEDTVASLSMFAQNALTGSDAGTSLKVMLQRLVPQSKEAKAMMDAIGFSAYDANGNFIGLTQTADMMQTSFSQLTPEARNSAMATIFGSDAVRAATIFYEQGASGVDSWRTAVTDAGYATRVAATMTDNLHGDVERLAGALETALVSSGSAANSMLRDMAQALIGVVNWYNQLSPSMQSSLTVGMGLVGVFGLMGAGLLLMLPRIMAVKAELVALGVTAARVRGAMMMLGRLSLVVGGLAAVGWGIGALAEKFHDAPPDVNKMANALVDLAQKGKAAGELTKTFGGDLDGFGEAVKRIAEPGVLDRVEDFFGTFDPTTDVGGPGLDSATEKVKALDTALGELVQSGATEEAAAGFNAMAKEAEANGISAEKLRTLLPQYSDALLEVDTTSKLAAAGQGELGAEFGMTTDEMGQQQTAAEKLSETLKALNGAAISTGQAEISFRQSLDDLSTAVKENSSAVKENGVGLDLTTEKGRATKSAFFEAAEAAMAHANAVTEQTGAQEAGEAALEANIAALKRQMAAAGFSSAQINDLTASYAQLPTAAETKIDAPGANEAMAAIAKLRERVMAVPPGKSITIKAPTAEAIKALEAAGYSVKKIPGTKNVTITAPTAGPVSNAQALAAALGALRDKHITLTTERITVYRAVQAAGGNNQAAKNAAETMDRRGGLIRGYATGGQVKVYPEGGPVDGPGTGQSDSIRARLSRGEFVIKAAAVRHYGVNAFAQLNAMQLRQSANVRVRRFATGGAVGTYNPTALPVLGGAGAGLARYEQLVGQLRDAWKEYKSALAELRKVQADKKSTAKERRDAQQRVTATWGTVNNLDAKLGLPKGAQAPAAFNLNAYQKQLNASLTATLTWRKNLATIGQRGGQEVRDLLEGMGEEGVALVAKLAGASTTQFNQIVASLKATAGLAKATLADFTSQLGTSTKTSEKFAKDLQTLAAQGFGDLAQALAAQGDPAAQALAAQAVTSSSAAAAANSAVGKANAALTGEELSSALVLLSTLRAKPGSGYAELLAAGLTTATIRALVPKMLRQINTLPAANKGKFLSQFAGQSGVVAMARGGRLDSAAMVLGGEAGVPEWWIPQDGSARSRSLLSGAAGAMGYRLTPASRYGTAPASGRTVVQEGDRPTTVNLYGAKQSSAEQAMDIARHLTFVG